MDIRLKRVYDHPEAEDGYRVLVDRLWPRGLKKEALEMDQWAKNITPPSDLRIAYHDGEIDFAAFAEQYIDFLEHHPDKEAFLKLIGTKLEKSHVTLLFAAKMTEHNHATVLRDWLIKNLRK